MDAHPSGGRWGTVSASVMRRPGLSAAKTVYATLSTYAGRAGWIWVRQETIASDLERSRSWVHAAIAELEGQGIVQHDRQYIEGRQRASRYRLRDGLPRDAGAASAAVSEKNDSAVQSADTSHYDEPKDSLSRDEGESNQRKRADRDQPRRLGPLGNLRPFLPRQGLPLFGRFRGLAPLAGRAQGQIADGKAAVQNTFWVGRPIRAESYGKEPDFQPNFPSSLCTTMDWRS